MFQDLFLVFEGLRFLPWCSLAGFAPHCCFHHSCSFGLYFPLLILCYLFSFSLLWGDHPLKILFFFHSSMRSCILFKKNYALVSMEVGTVQLLAFKVLLLLGGLKICGSSNLFFKKIKNMFLIHSTRCSHRFMVIACQGLFSLV